VIGERMNKFIEFIYDGNPILMNTKRIIYFAPAGPHMTTVYLNEGTELLLEESYEEVKEKLFEVKREGAQSTSNNSPKDDEDWVVGKNPPATGVYLTTLLNTSITTSPKRELSINTYNKSRDIWYKSRYVEVVAWKRLPDVYMG
jgi:uncharacterized protein YlzI (FlbEa/FlbD family)